MASLFWNTVYVNDDNDSDMRGIEKQNPETYKKKFQFYKTNYTIINNLGIS